jgi:hypothetical protein
MGCNCKGKKRPDPRLLTPAERRGLPEPAAPPAPKAEEGPRG